MPRAASCSPVCPSLDAFVSSADLRRDAIYYVSSHYKPHTLIDVATLTGYVIHGLKHDHCTYGLTVPWKSRWERSSAASSRCVFLNVRRYALPDPL